LVPTPQEASNENAREAAEALAGLRTDNLEEGGATGMLIEGTRARDGKLQTAKQGINRLFGSEKVRESAIILPVGLLGTNDVLPIGSKSINLKAKVETSFGEPFSYDQAKGEMEAYRLSLAEVIMLHIAVLLPREKWGVYRELFSKII
jgi:1-acyl-sn-glycerol-3-phosphate acyltransferase